MVGQAEILKSAWEWESMNPGATTNPSASNVSLASAGARSPTAAILPFSTATSALNPLAPEPSITRPFFISKSYIISPGV